MKIARIFGLYNICCLLYFPAFIAAQSFEAALEADGQYFNHSLIRVNSMLVSVPVLITDVSGQKITALRIEDFRLTEDGMPVEISRLAESSNLNIALLFDVSGSVYNNFEFQQNTAIDFLQKIWEEGDTATIISFDDQLEVWLKNGDDLQEAMRTLRQIRPTGRTTSFFDAVVMAVRLLEQSVSEETRQAIIVLSDGVDNTSAASLALTLTEMRRRSVVFYAINPRNEDIVRLNKTSASGQENLTVLANVTGGTVFVSDETRHLENIFSKITAELRAQYLLLYYSLIPNMDGKFHTIEVSIPDQPGLNIRTRTGFLAVNSSTE